MKLRERRLFFEGMNGDLFSRDLGDKESINLMNCRMGITETGRLGRLENVMGTTQISDNVHPPYGIDQTIGSAVDFARRRLVKFNYNSFGYHWIGCLDTTTNITYAVLYDTQVIGGLNFSKTSRINRNARVVGDMLYWTDDNNQPRRMNMEAGIKTNHPSYVTGVAPYNWPMTASTITLIRKPPGVQPGAAPNGADANTKLKDFSGQFAFRYIDRDNEITVFGNPSLMVEYETGVRSFITVGWGTATGEVIPQDVKIVQLGVRYGNNPQYFIIKEWNKGNPTDLAIINSFNNLTGPLQYDFYNDEIGIAVSLAASVKPYDSIPIRCKTLEYANYRLFLANYLKGYDTPVVTSLSGNTTIGGGAGIKVYKSYSSHQIGIVFRDFYKRKSFTVTNDSLVIPIPDRLYSMGSGSFTNYITWALSNANALNEIPDWAYYYDIVITKNLRTRFFLESKSTTTKYAIKNTDGTFSYQDTYSATAYGIAINLSGLDAQGMGYIFNDGDIARLYVNGTATAYSLSVLGQDGNYALLQLANLGAFTVQPDILYEIYTPYTKSDNEIFYTTENQFSVTNPGTALRSYSTLSGNVIGNVFTLSIGPTYREAMSPVDKYWQNWYFPYGDANQVSLLGQVDKENFIQWSNPIIEGSQTNGLSSFEALNEKAIPSELGGINKIQLAKKISDQGQGNIMIAICDEESASLYLSEAQLVGASKPDAVAISDQVIGTINVLKGSFGTIAPETVFEYLGLVFFYDLINGVFVQYSPNGLEPVSRYKMSRFFKNYAKDYLAASTGNLDNINGFHHIPTCIDPFNKEVIVGTPGLIYENYANVLPSYTSVPSYATSIIDRFDIYDRLQKTMTFKFEENYWGSNFNYAAEWYEYIDNQLYGFKNGISFSHNTDSVHWNRFYGIDYPMRVCVTGNLNASALKVLNNISLESSVAPDFTVAMTNYPNVQITDLKTNLAGSDYRNQEGVFYADFFRDRLSPNTTGTADEKLYKGDSLTDFSIFVMAEFQQYSQLAWVAFLDIGYSLSRGHKSIVDVINR